MTDPDEPGQVSLLLAAPFIAVSLLAQALGQMPYVHRVQTPSGPRTRVSFPKKSESNGRRRRGH